MSEPDIYFGEILNGYFDADKQERRFKATCAALTLLKHTANLSEISTIRALETSIPKVADGIQKTLEKK
ncbi:hypothetical protein F9817_08585 [Vibrio sp. CAIM 722]|uniref:Uncharacterized protein n=1 Tax=Vibrio eleionomae TaxID=2653505 RepID=A0A7X4LKE2_9VIBR|nr:hypothetical protein [Vibrio eleionomae]MZI93252.1 hypothetical protein [Vibrio eleionomae]